MNDAINTETRHRVHQSFLRQKAMNLIRAEMPVIEHGYTQIHIPHWSGIEQQHGFIHGGILGMIADSAGGYAAMTVVPKLFSVLTVEYKMNILTPAKGEILIAEGSVVRAGRTLIVTKTEVFSLSKNNKTLCALMQQTIMALANKPEI